jgi:hypothetical protein
MMGQRRRMEGREKENLLLFSKRVHKIEFKQIKTMQQHVCNNKLL